MRGHTYDELRIASLQVCRALVGLGRFDEAAAVAAAAMPFLKGRLCGTPLSLELHWLAASIADRREDRVGAAKAARVVINHRPWDIAPWNLFARTTAQARRGEPIRQTRLSLPLTRTHTAQK